MVALLAVMATGTGCSVGDLGAIDLLGGGDLFGGLLGGLLGGNGSAADGIYISVYNFHSKTVRAEVTFRDQAGVERVLAVTADGTSPIPSDTRGSLDIGIGDITTQADSPVTVTFTFPQDGDAQVVLDLTRDAFPTNKRVRFGVIGATDDLVGWFADP
jgi:hypothetical protein